MSITLGIDIGTSATKALAIDETGRIMAAASAEYPCSHPRPGWSEQDPEHWWQAAVQTVATVLAAGKFRPADVAGIGLSGQMHGSVFLDQAGNVIRPALLWNDQRTAAECREIEEKAGGREAIIRLVANPALTGFTAPKMLWLRNNEPKSWERVRQVLLPKDYVRYRFTGTYATEVSDASGTLLLDVANRRWSRPLLDRLAIDPALLPSCHESEEVSAKLSEAGSKATGLASGHAGRGRGRRSARRGGGQRYCPPRRGLGDDGDLGRRFRARRQAGLRPLGPAPARLSCGQGRLACDGRRPGGRRQLSVVPQRAGQSRGRVWPRSAGTTPTSCSPPRRRLPASVPRACSFCPI